MNESTPPDAPDSGATPLQRIFMDRALAQAERDLVKPPRRPLQAVVALVMAIAVVTIILLGFDKFLASVQRALHVMEEQDKVEAQRTRLEAEQKRNQEPMPAYAVAPLDEPASRQEPSKQK
jgi:hypothetical protein